MAAIKLCVGFRYVLEMCAFARASHRIPKSRVCVDESLFRGMSFITDEICGTDRFAASASWRLWCRSKDQSLAMFCSIEAE